MKLDGFIEAEKQAGRSIARCCRLFDVSRAAYYQRRNGQPCRRVLSDGELTDRIRTIHKRWRTTTIADPDAAAAADRIQRAFDVGGPVDARYVGDITYIATWEGWAYLATASDLSTRRVVGWALADDMRTELVADALNMAFTQRRPPAGLVFHSDRGCQYTSGDYAALAAEHKVVLSVGRRGQCLLTGTTPWPSRSSRRSSASSSTPAPGPPAPGSAVPCSSGSTGHNTRRLHSSLGYRTPAEADRDHQLTVSRQAA